MKLEAGETVGVGRRRLPAWLRVPFRGARARTELRSLFRGLNLHTVCEGAHCPNLCECWSRHTATFLLLGNVCTRNCRFCAVTNGVPQAPDADEPFKVAEAARKMGLRYVVLTSVTRDDLPDGGSGHFATTVRAIRARLPQAAIEVLPPDFGGRAADVATVLAARPEVFNHNLETCARLTPLVRSGADYRRSLAVLAIAAQQVPFAGLRVKSGIMLGMGEEPAEIREMLRDLRASGVEILTIGQYLPPSAAHWPLGRYVPPEEFAVWADVARREYGFAHVVSGPLVRSSYQAEAAAQAAGAVPEPTPDIRAMSA